MFKDIGFQLLGPRNKDRSALAGVVEQNGGTILKCIVAGSSQQVVIYQPSPYLSNYTLNRAYRNNIPVVDSTFIEDCCESNIFSYQQAVKYSKQNEDNYRKRKRDDQETEPVYHTPTMNGSRTVSHPRKVKKYVDYPEHLSLDIDMDTNHEYSGDNLTELQKHVKTRNNSFQRWDLDDVQQEFFSQFLVELDNSVFDIKQDTKTLDILKEILNSEKTQKTEGSTFLEAFIKSYQDNNKLSPFSIFFKLETHWESTIQSILNNLFLHPVAYEKDIFFGTSELSNQYYLSEALTKRAEKIKNLKKLEEKQDLFPYFFLSKPIFEETTLDTFLICEAQRNDFENDDVFLHKDICNLILYMRCMFKHLIDRLSTNNCLTPNNLEKIRLFGALIAGTTIAWLEMRIEFKTHFDPVAGQSLPPFTYCVKISDIYDLTTVEGLAESLMILQHTFNLVNSLAFEPGKPSAKGSINLFNTTGKTIDTSQVYTSLISVATFNCDTGTLIDGMIDIPQKLTLGEIENIPQQESRTASNSAIDFSLFLQNFKFELLSCLKRSEGVIKVSSKEIPSIAILNPDQSIDLLLDYPSASTPILLICKQNSILTYLVIKPTNEDGWRLALDIKRPTDHSEEKDCHNNGENDGNEGDDKNSRDNNDGNNNNSRNNNSGDNQNSGNQSPMFDLCLDNNLLENIEQMSYLKKKFDMVTKNNALVPSIFSLLNCFENHTKIFVYCQAHVAAPLVIVFRTISPFGGRRRFIKLTHGSVNETETMKYLQGLDNSVKNGCNHVAQIHKFEQVFLKDNNELFFAAHLINKQHFGKEICNRLRVENFDSYYTQKFFDLKTPIELTYMELLDSINVKEILKKMPTSRESSSMLKVLISIRWIGQCLTMLQQLHSNLNILHCDISFDNIMTRKSVGSDKIAHIIQEECNHNGITSEQFISDLVISDLNTSVKLQPIQNTGNDESRGSISHPDAVKFPYTWHTYDFYGTMQADNYAMAIFIAKLVRRLVFEDFTDFTTIDKPNSITFNTYRESVAKYFDEKKNDENVDPIQKNFLSGITDLLLYILHQKKETPSKLTNCIKMYQSKIANLDTFITLK